MSRWEQIEKICQSTLELEENQRAAFLEEACAGDQALRREVESLLRFEGRRDRFIEQPALQMAAKMIADEKPESLIGRQLGSYQILALLGAGGMGVVYKARDIRLNRSVAIKILPPDRITDPERKRRFIQEARAASALNHPHIITIHDIGSESDTDFIVMEYVQGKTLDQLISRKGMRLNEALKLAVQMADALAKAHSAGIIHRDLKPSNVMVSDEGVIKVLDFGLAKLNAVSESADDATRSLRHETEEGMIVGTVSYMSPEQAEGRKIDARSDIFSFGAVLYEMVSGQKAFQGDSKMSTVAAILKQEPKPISKFVPDIPSDLEKIITRCLRKDPGRRFQHMEDLKVELEELKEESDSGIGTPSVVRSSQRTWVWAATALFVAAMAVVTWLLRGSASKRTATPELIPLTTYAGLEYSPSFSPDGSQVAFTWNGEKQDNFDIYIKLIGSPTPVRLTTDPARDLSPAFSPDGHSIGFIRVSREGATFIVIPAIGGPERTVAEVPSGDFLPSFAWLPNGQWVVTDGLTLLSTESGETRRLTSAPTKLSRDFSPAVSLDGHTVAFSRSSGFQTSDIYLLELTEDLLPKGEPRRLTTMKGSNLWSAWTPSGKEIIFSSGLFVGSGMSLWRVLASGIGEPERLSFTASGEAFLPAISRNGNRLAYASRAIDCNIWHLSLSARGVASAPPVKLIASTRNEEAPQYSPDGTRIAFESTCNGPQGIWVSNADGSNAVELFSKAGAGCGTPRWAPDAKRIAFDSNMDGSLDIYVIPAKGGKPVRLTNDSADDEAPSWSKDGKWIYFASKRTGRLEVWKVSAGGGKAVQVTRNGGGTAFESPDGEAIYYTKDELSLGLWKLALSGTEEKQVLPSVAERNFSLTKDGIYFISEPGADRKSSIQLLSFTTGEAKAVAMVSRPAEGLSVSPDGRSLLFSQLDEAGSDLMLLEGFR